MVKVCKKCKLFVKGTKCPLCKGNAFTESHKGKVIILSEDSEIAKKLEIKDKGEYAVRIR